MSASWVAVLISVAVATGAAARAVWLGGQRDGKLDSILASVDKILVDHEKRLRDLEGNRRR